MKENSNYNQQLNGGGKYIDIDYRFGLVDYSIK